MRKLFMKGLNNSIHRIWQRISVLRTTRINQGFFILLVSLSCALPANSAAAYFDESALGRLFTTPQQRHKIDVFRKGNGLGITHEQSSPTDVKVQGIMTRSGGKSTVWVNGKSTLESSKVGGVDVRLNSLNHKTDRVTVVIDKKAVRLKPGQVWSEDSGKVSDSY